MNGKKSPELDYILATCLRSNPERFDSKLDWNEIFRLVEGNRITTHFLKDLPASVRKLKPVQKLETIHQRNAYASMWLVGEVIQVTQLANQLKIPVYFYKGPVWSQWLYNDYSFRSSGDLDLLVSEKHLFNLIDALLMNGYAVYSFHKALLESPDSVRKSFIANDYHIPLQKTDKDGKILSTLEVHWKIAYPRLCYHIHPDDFLKFSSSMAFSGVNLLTSIHELQLLMLLINHGGKEGWNRLRYLFDLKAYMDRYGHSTDWDLVYKLAHEKSVKALVNKGLGILRGAGYKWSQDFPPVRANNIDRLRTVWIQLEPQNENGSWHYFRNAWQSHDLRGKSELIVEHLKYFSQFGLHRYKLRWYRQRKTV